MSFCLEPVQCIQDLGTDVGVGGVGHCLSPNYKSDNLLGTNTNVFKLTFCVGLGNCTTLIIADNLFSWEITYKPFNKLRFARASRALNNYT